MSPVPQETSVSIEAQNGLQPKIDGESVVISGISGLFPLSNHVKEFSENLYNKVNMVSDNTRYTFNHSEVQNYCGTVPGLERFDAQFFGVHYRLTMTMDPMAKKLLEHTYQAIYDAGVNPEILRGSKTGVFTGSCFSEAEKAFFYVAAQRNGHGIVGCCKAMFANRISYWLDAKGPSLSIDSMCASSLIALECAVQAIRRGDCDAAVVGGANLCLHPQSSILYGRTIPMSSDGKTKSFDKNADGSARSEAVNVIFLQKAKDAKRIYAEVCHVHSKFTAILGENGSQHYGPHRPVDIIRNFFHECYDGISVRPHQVEYIEAFGTAIPEAERNELEAISQVFCKERNNPLLVGSVMSNMGYSEAASGVSSIIKICLGYHTGQLAGNLHYANPHDLPALCDGRMKVIDDHTAFNRTYTAVNNFSISGANAHALLKGFWKEKDPTRYLTNIPYLVGVSGRQETAVKRILDDLKSRPVDAEEIGLLHSIHDKNIHGHLARGYSILSTNEANETVALVESCEYFADVRRPLWFVYSGMGSQWSTMGAELLKFPIFANAIERCRKVLEPRGVDIVKILTDPDKHTFDNILNSFVGIAAVQIGLTDILNALDIKPDYIIGHSVGELGCAYADGCFTAEEMILAAYSRGLVSVQTPFIRGSMAAVGVGYKTIKDMCPPEIEVACHNGPDSSTISGPAVAMKEFVARLTAKGIFAKEVPCSNIAYHSRYIAEAGPGLRKYLSEVIMDPKERSEKWLSTSVPQDRWNEESAKYSSADYHTNNLLSPVLFEETARLIPQNAVVIEVAPHGLLQAILKRSLGENCTNIPLTRRGASEPVTFLLNAVGKMYQLGYNPKIQALYPKIEFPVSTGTPMLSHLVEWIHSEHWPLAIYAAANRLHAAERHFVMSVHDDEYKYIEGHVVEGKNIFPLSAVLVVVWETLAMVWREKQRYLGVQFHDVHYYRDAVIRSDQPLELAVTIQRGSGRFEVTHDNFLIVSGTITRVKQSLFAKHLVQFGSNNYDTTELVLDKDDIYRMFYKKGYGFRNEFSALHKANLDLTNAKVPWNGNWVTLIDNMLQLNILRRNHDGVSKPKYIRRLTIDTKTHEQTIVIDKQGNTNIFIDKSSNLTKCGGVIIKDAEFIDVPTHKCKSLIVKSQQFMPYYPSGCLDVKTVLHAYLQTVSDNLNEEEIKALEIVTSECNDDLRSVVLKTLEGLPSLAIELDNATSDLPNLSKVKLILGRNIVHDNKIIQYLLHNLTKDSFILSFEDRLSKDYEAPYKVVASANTPQGILILHRWTPVKEQFNNICVTVDEDLGFMTQVRGNLAPMDRLMIVTKFPPTDGLKELVKTWRKEAIKNKVYLIMTDKQTISDDQFMQVSDSQLAFNVFIDDTVGNEFSLPLKDYRTNQNLKLVCGQPGDLETLMWSEIPVPSNSSNILVKVCYAGPTVIDVQRASGAIQFNNNGESPAFGMDFCGFRIGSGERVMGIVGEGALSGIVEADPELLWPIPRHWSLEDAATVPLPYAYAMYCLAIRSRALPGDRVLIHGGAGALGQAAISVALSIGCEVFTTVSDTRKKHFIKKLFPELLDDHIGNSRDNSFETMIHNVTKGKGCAIVLNTLKGELRESSTRCVGYEGVILDVAVKDIYKNNPFRMSYLSNERQYVPAIFSTIFKMQDSAQKKLLQRMMCEGITKGFVRPLSRVVYKPDEVTKAFKLVAGCKNRGRSLIHMSELSTLSVTPRLTCSPKASYVIVCNKDSFGIEVAERLVQRGARNIMLCCDTNYHKGYLLKHIKSWNAKGVSVKVTSGYLLENNSSVVLLNEGNEMGPVEGLFIVHGVNGTDEDKLLLDVLDHASRKVCPKLKYFSVIHTVATPVEGHVKTIMAERKRKDLPSLLLLLPNLTEINTKDINEKDEPQLSVMDALNVLESSLKLKNDVITTNTVRQNANVKIIVEVLKILGTNNDMIEDLPSKLTLQQLGADFDMADRISRYLSEKHSIYYKRDVVLNLSIAELKLLQESVQKKLGQRETRGLDVFYTGVDPDELQATVDMVLMPTFIHNSTQRDDEFNSNETYLTIVPGLEGHYGMFHCLCQRLKLPAVVLQPPLDRPLDSVQEIAQRFVKTMKKNMDLNGKKFYLLGYSFGVLVAMEMATLLEEYGHEGVIFCIDSAPQVFGKQLAHVLGDISEEQLQNAVVEHIYSLLTNKNMEAVKKAIKLAKTWDDKVTTCMLHLSGNVHISAQYAKSIIQAAYLRIITARKYEATIKKLKSQIVLMKAKTALDLDEDYGLLELTEKDLTIYDLDSDHGDAVQDMRCSNIVNRHLEEYLLEKFAARNLCESYLINAAKFMDSSLPKTDE